VVVLSEAPRAFTWRMMFTTDSRAGRRRNKHALKHGRYTGEAMGGRREIRKLIRAMRASARQEQVKGARR
jgi:hypothetical protein